MFKAKQILKFAFGYFDLDYKNFILQNKKFFRKSDVEIKRSDFKKCLKRNSINRKAKIFGRRLVYTLIKYYLNEKKY